MSDISHDNPPAFPVGVPQNFQFANEGMSLRDYLAAQALAAVIAATSAGQHQPRIAAEDEGEIRFAIARDAYEMADAMLAVRTKGRPE